MDANLRRRVEQTVAMPLQVVKEAKKNQLTRRSSSPVNAFTACFHGLTGGGPGWRGTVLVPHSSTWARQAELHSTPASFVWHIAHNCTLDGSGQDRLHPTFSLSSSSTPFKFEKNTQWNYFWLSNLF
jgi:hypothetical protein